MDVEAQRNAKCFIDVKQMRDIFFYERFEGAGIWKE